MTRSLITRRFAVLFAIILALSATQVQAQWEYYYFKDPQPLALDASRIAIQPSDRAAKRLATEGLAEFGIAASDIEPHALKTWAYAKVPPAKRVDAQVRTLVEQIAAGDSVEFVSPVFLDARGLPLLITRYLHVGFAEGTKPEEAERILAKLGAGDILERNWSRLKGVYRLQAGSRNGFDVLELANTLARRGDVTFAEPDMIAKATKEFLPNDPGFINGWLWGLHNTGQFGGLPNLDMDGPEAWDLTTGSPNVIVVIIDDGVEQHHPDINQIAGEDFTGEGTGGAPGNECDNHGTAVAGCTSAIIDNSLGTVGSAPGCKIVSARYSVSDVPCSGGGTFSVSGLAAALDWALEIGARVTSISSSFSPFSTITAKYNATRAAGIIHFGAAGNTTGSTDLEYPAELSSVNAITGVWRTGTHYGTSGEGTAFTGPAIDIYTTDRTGSDGYTGSDYATVDGTSFATPYVAGVAALLISQESTLTPDLVEEAMQETAKDLGSAGYDTEYGWGIPSAGDALEWLGPPALPCDLGKVTAGDAAADSRFGWAVAMDHDVYVVGAPYDDGAGGNAGAAYVYRRTGTSWTFEEKLVASDAALEDRFGFAVAVSGDVVVVGAYQNDAVASDSGAVYVFRFNGIGWDQEQKLIASDAADSDRFGYTVSVDGDVVVAGAYANDDAGASSGSAYVFRYGGTWQEEQKLTALDASTGDSFGWTVSVSGTHVLVGAPQDDVFGTNSGAVYMYEYDGMDWDNETKIIPPDAAEGDNFGYSVAVDGDLFVVGAQLVDSHVVNSGAVYLYRLSGHTWSMEQKLRASDGAEEDRFGYVVSLADEVVAVGAYRNDEAGADAGAAYVYAYNGFRGYWGLEEKLTAFDAYANQQFGRAVAVKRGFALVGVPYDADAGTDTGAAYLYAAGTDCNRNRTPDICDIRDGISDDVDDNGVPDDCCPQTFDPQPDPVGVPKNRYVSFAPNNGGQPVALRVTFVDLPAPFTGYNGQHRWVDTPRAISEASGTSGSTPPPTFWGANLRCDPPLYYDWTDVDLLYVFDEAIVPGGEYSVQAIAESCDTGSAESYSASVTVQTAGYWGDLVGDCGVFPCTPPDGLIDFIDISAVVDKFRNLPTAPVKARVDLVDDMPDAIIDFQDISRAVDAFRGYSYPFSGPQACPP